MMDFRRMWLRTLGLATVVLVSFCSNVETAISQEAQAVAEFPKGEIKGPFRWESQIFPGTVRNFWLYVPAQYDGQTPACVMVVQDGLQLARRWKLIEAWDRLIANGEIPVQIGIMIEPGVVPAPHDDAQPRFNRSFEYDGLGDRYARFLVEEILPAVGQDYSLSKRPGDRAIAGSSSGGICAFTTAWERPDQFGRVLSTIGTYVGLRGGNEYPILVRKTEPKPLRIFLQDGNQDQNIYGGNWWISNQQMLSALEFSGYEVKHVWGEGGHNSKHASQIMTAAVRWLWQGHPKPIGSAGGKKRRTDILIEGEDWERVSDGHGFTEGPTVSASGEVFFTDIPNDKIYKINVDGTVVEFVSGSEGANGLMFGPEGWLYACQTKTGKIVRYDSDAKMEVFLEEASANDIVLLPGGGYYTDPDHQRVCFFDWDGNQKVVDEGLAFPNGVVVSPDQTLLMVSDTRDRFTYSYQIQPNGDLKFRQKYGHLHRRDGDRDCGSDGMAVDRDGRTYVTTRNGLQVMDALGRVHLILRKPQPGWMSNVVFGGVDRNWLYVTCQNAVYRRKVKTQGFDSVASPFKPPRPGL